MAEDKKRISIIGSGNWGSVIAKIVGNNVRNNPKFENEVKMYVYEEMVDGKPLSKIINEQHENVKYLAGHKLPDNVVAVTDVGETTKDSDILVFVVPHQFLLNLCKAMKPSVKPGAIGVSLIKGLHISDYGLDLISNLVRKTLDIPCAVLMGANIAPEVARENYCEATIGCQDKVIGELLKEIMQTDYFRIVVVEDEHTVELCGALKNVIATGAGFIDGLGLGNNTKAAVIRLGFKEMIKLCEVWMGSNKVDTFLESCGVADLVTTCYSGRNRRVAEAFAAAKGSKTIEELERDLLNGQKLQGPPTAAEVNVMLKQKNMEDRFPMFTAIHKICIGEMPVETFIDCLKNHPEHMTSRI